jgi:hypothetical protein
MIVRDCNTAGADQGGRAFGEYRFDGRHRERGAVRQPDDNGGQGASGHLPATKRAINGSGGNIGNGGAGGFGGTGTICLNAAAGTGWSNLTSGTAPQFGTAGQGGLGGLSSDGGKGVNGD